MRFQPVAYSLTACPLPCLEIKLGVKWVKLSADSFKNSSCHRQPQENVSNPTNQLTGTAEGEVGVGGAFSHGINPPSSLHGRRSPALCTPLGWPEAVKVVAPVVRLREACLMLWENAPASLHTTLGQQGKCKGRHGHSPMLGMHSERVSFEGLCPPAPTNWLIWEWGWWGRGNFKTGSPSRALWAGYQRTNAVPPSLSEGGSAEHCEILGIFNTKKEAYSHSSYAGRREISDPIFLWKSQISSKKKPQMAIRSFCVGRTTFLLAQM